MRAPVGARPGVAAPAAASGSGGASGLLVPAQGALLGAFVGTGTIAQLETTLGRKLAISHNFYGWTDNYTTWVRTTLQNGYIPLVTWEASMERQNVGVPLDEIMAVKPRIVAPAQPIKLTKPVRGELAFRNLSFAYPGRENDAVLRNVSFRVAPGEVVAIVGPSGAGKSTLFQLALRFYDPASGAVMLDGVDISMLDPADLRAEIALVPQDAFIFGASVADNIAYGAPGATREAVIVAAKQAVADRFISAMPQGYDTFVGERGVALWGASASASPSPARFSKMPLCCSSTRRRRPSTPRAKTSSKAR